MNAIESKQLITYLNERLDTLKFPANPVKRGSVFEQIYAMKLPDAIATYASYEDAQAIAEDYFERNELDLNLGRVPQVAKPLKGSFIRDDKARDKFWKDVNEKCFNKHQFPTDPKARHAFVHEVIGTEHIEQSDYDADTILKMVEAALDTWEHSEDVNEMEGNVDNDPIADIGDEATEQEDPIDYTKEKAEVKAIFKYYAIPVNFQKATQYATYEAARVGMKHEAILSLVETYCKRENNDHVGQPKPIVQPETGVMPYDPVNEIEELRHTLLSLKSRAFLEGVDYDTIPGTNKPSLLLPGMEKIMRVMRLRPEYTLLPTSIIDFDKPLFSLDYECRIVEVDSGLVRATAIGSCNSHETKYRCRWVKEHELPMGVKYIERRHEKFTEFAWAIDKGETTGKYGKPAEYWQRFRDAITDQTAIDGERESNGKVQRTWTIEGDVYKIPNTDVADQLNTMHKIAQKRGLGSAVKLVANASEFFTTDLEKKR